ncbi:ParB-like partition protein [Burkholderiales bacterium JOSHI_001]|nr:ParB-like partition protein [Burkholderiales bacterium JOSHI_001]
MPLQLDDLAALDAPALDASGVPLMLSIDSIDEDAEQPRHEFDTNALQELADTIRERGVRQPISVRPNLQQSGRWILNFGARRLRAARLAGLTTIPAFIDTTADNYDQVIENEQREGLRPLELAMFVQKRLALGDNQAEIAKRLGKSRQWVTLATAMIEPPDWLLDLYRQGRCRGMMELYELRRLHGEHPQYIEAWVADRDAITRDGVAGLRAELNAAAVGSARPGASTLMQAIDSPPADSDPSASGLDAATPAKPRPKTNTRLHVEMDGQDYQLVVSVAPIKAGHLYIRPLKGGPRSMAPASALKLRGFVSR